MDIEGELPRLVMTDRAGYVRDTKSHAVLNVDHTDLAAYRRRAKLLRESTDSLNTVQEDLDGLKSEILEIKDLLRQLVKTKE